jgi:low affinity Fe/Cu permease
MKKFILVLEKNFELFTEKITIMLGHSFCFFIAIVIVLVWIGTDIYHSSNWHVLINDTVFSFTFLMVFILQKMQNKFSAVMNAKLNELVAAHENASNRLIKAEDMTEEELRKLAIHYQTLSSAMGKNDSLTTSGSIENVIKEIEEKNKEENT